MAHIKRGDNAKGFAVLHIAVDAGEEMLALESLGRAARQAILDAPIKFSALTVLKEIERQELVMQARTGQHVKIDIKLPDVDRFLAQEIMRQSITIVAQDRSREDALCSIQPLHGKPSARSVREQRKAMRRVRW